MYKFLKLIVATLSLISLIGCSSTSIQPHELNRCELKDITIDGNNDFCSTPRVSLISHNRLLIGFDNGTIATWDLSSNKLIKKFESTDNFAIKSVVETQNNLLFGSADTKLKQYSLNGSLLEEFSYEKGSIFALALYKEKLLIGFGNAEIGVVDLNDLKLIKAYRQHEYLIYTLYVDEKNGLLYSGSDDNSIIVWNISKNGLLSKIKKIDGFKLSVRHILNMNDGSLIVTTGSGNVVVYDKTFSKILNEYNEHSGIVLSAKTEGNYLITGDSFGNLVYWVYGDGKLKVIEKHKMDSSVRIIEILPNSILAISKFGQVLSIKKSNLTSPF